MTPKSRTLYLCFGFKVVPELAVGNAEPLEVVEVPDAELPLLPFDEEPEEPLKAVAVVAVLVFVVTDPVPVAVPVTFPGVGVCTKIAPLVEGVVLELDPEVLARVLLLHDPELAILW